jgi:hypothetical protein
LPRHCSNPFSQDGFDFMCFMNPAPGDSSAISQNGQTFGSLRVDGTAADGLFPVNTTGIFE